MADWTMTATTNITIEIIETTDIQTETIETTDIQTETIETIVTDLTTTKG